MNHIFLTNVLLIHVMECIIELNWLCKHIWKIRSSQPVIIVLNWIKQLFPVSIVKRRTWNLGGSKKQKGGFLPILGTLARHLLVSAAAAIGEEVLKGLGKIIWGEEDKEGTEEEGKGFSMPWNKILLRRLANPKCMQLPNGRLFFVKYERVHRHALAPTRVV